MKDVLYIGPDHRGHRGGIGAVLDTYSANIRPFKFIPTYDNSSAFKRQLVFLKAIFVLAGVMIKDKDIKIVHIHSAQKGSFIRKSIMLLISRLFGKKVVLHMHASSFHVYYQHAGWVRHYIRYIFKKADAVICLSDKWHEFYSSNFKIKRLLIIKNVIERPEVKVSVPSDKGLVKLLFLGLIGERKGLFDLLKVLEINKELFGDKLTLRIGGNGEVEKLKQTLLENHKEGNVTFEGWVTGKQKNELLKDCDIYILPSYNEGLPISILEAMAHGKPIISTTIGGIPEIVIPGKNGWLFNPGDIRALTAILTEVIGNKNLLKEYGEYSYRLSEGYTPLAVMDSLRNLYDQLLIA